MNAGVPVCLCTIPLSLDHIHISGHSHVGSILSENTNRVYLSPKKNSDRWDNDHSNPHVSLYIAHIQQLYINPTAIPYWDPHDPKHTPECYRTGYPAGHLVMPLYRNRACVCACVCSSLLHLLDAPAAFPVLRLR